ncbi:hypothetical protein PZ897_14030 [Hoeflea sp. YIM 152468]|uniref:hypothetical protein n=1 Tax=Hoeflea sp. YIM 152468 TaxID=3031759 RepID=UPI0023DC5E8E|nr:hypothetical protein [Hoeflea sp. YIM 152468]MDF1609301.1 hypothetical protein [Hoeflea sp. YIM 152468]
MSLAIERNAMSNGGSRRIQPTIPEGYTMSLHRSQKSSIAASALLSSGKTMAGSKSTLESNQIAR